ncbi:MAG: hypothetical protein ACLP01_07870 [Solirubrobacteraceae bacterium]
MESHITSPTELSEHTDEDARGNGAPPAAAQQAVTLEPRSVSEPSVKGNPAADTNDGIAGMSVLRGLLLYGAVLTFAGLYIYFVVLISTSKGGTKPPIDATLISATAALSGVLGSAFALKIGVAPNPTLVNKGLAAHLAHSQANKAAVEIRRALSLEPSDPVAKSWPLTFGIWAYAIVGSMVLVTYLLNQNETPDAVKALAVTFGGYMIALINMAYGMTKQSAV